MYKKEINMKKNIICNVSLVTFIFILSFSITFASALTETNKTTQQQAAACINDSIKIMNELAQDGFNTLRVNDTIRQASLTYTAQSVLKDKKQNYDFTSVANYCNQIVQIRNNAFSSRDELGALLRFYNDSIVPGMDTIGIDSIINEIKEDINTERYEEVPPLVDEAYSEISNVKASYTTLNIFYKNTTKTLQSFFEAYWQTIVILLIILIVAFFAYRTKIREWMLNRKIEALQLRKKTLKELIMNLQINYFQEGKIPEGEYNIKTKKFAELIRDIDRQIPLLEEELLKIEKKINNKKKEREDSNSNIKIIESNIRSKKLKSKVKR